MKARIRIYLRRRVLFVLRWFSQNSSHSKFVGVCAEYFEQADGNVENSFIHSLE